MLRDLTVADVGTAPHFLPEDQPETIEEAQACWCRVA